VKRGIPIRLIVLLFFAIAILLCPLSAFSQSCALCYTQAASTGARMIQALKSGILILIIPPTIGSIGMVFVLRRKRNQVRQTEYGLQTEQDW
jgi:hypothetical protein